MKAEFLNYGMLSIMSLLVEGLKKYVLTSTKKLFFPLTIAVPRFWCFSILLLTVECSMGHFFMKSLSDIDNLCII